MPNPDLDLFNDAYPSEVQKDMEFLRHLRQSHENYKKIIITSILGSVVTGLCYGLYVLIEALKNRVSGS